MIQLVTTLNIDWDEADDPARFITNLQDGVQTCVNAIPGASNAVTVASIISGADDDATG